MENGGWEDVVIQKADLPRAVAAVKLGALLIVDRGLTERQYEVVRSIAATADDFRVVLMSELTADR